MERSINHNRYKLKAETLDESLVSKISQLQENAMARKPKVAQMADHLSQYFVFAVLFISTITFVT